MCGHKVRLLSCFRESFWCFYRFGMNAVKPAGVSVDIGEIKGTGGDTHASEYV